VRPALSPRHPVHVIARTVPAARLDGRAGHRAIRRALARSLARDDFRVIELAIRARRVELVVEAADRLALARGMQGFQVSAARLVNRALGRRGAVFPDRYRATALVTRAAVRAVIARSGAAGPRSGGAWRRAGWPETWLLAIELGEPRAVARPILHLIAH